MSRPRAAPDKPLAWHSLPVADALHQQSVAAARGLSQQAASERLEQYGRNSLPPPRRRGPFLRFALQFHNPLIYVLIVAGAVTFALGDYVDAGRDFRCGTHQRRHRPHSGGQGGTRAGRGTQHAGGPRNRAARCGERHQIDATELVPGDIVLLESGDKVPADLRLTAVKNLRVVESALTGESAPVEKDVAAVAADAGIGDRSSMCHSGTLVAYGLGQGIVIATGSGTEIGRIGTLVGETQSLATPLTRRLDQFARQITGFILAVSVLTLLYGHFVTRMPMLDLFLAVVGLAVAAIPEGMPAVVTIVLAIGTRTMARKMAIVRRLPAVETLGSVTVICSDKTGTLTKNEMTGGPSCSRGTRTAGHRRRIRARGRFPPGWRDRRPGRRHRAARSGLLRAALQRRTHPADRRWRMASGGRSHRGCPACAGAQGRA
jgi:magnesium-transporting ATPase (P-type)